MALFEEPFGHTIDTEGLQGFTVAGDRGGETVFGIARKFHPTWKGWPIFDAARDKPGFPNSLLDDSTFLAAVKNFYRVKFWDVIRGDEIPFQAVAAELFDTAVNCGPRTAVIMLQEILNVGNREGQDWGEITADGKMGPATIGALKACVEKRGVHAVVKVLNQRQGDRYFEIAKNDETQERFFWGWILRRT